MKGTPKCSQALSVGTFLHFHSLHTCHASGGKIISSFWGQASHHLMCHGCYGFIYKKRLIISFVLTSVFIAHVSPVQIPVLQTRKNVTVQFIYFYFLTLFLFVIYGFLPFVL